MPRQSEFLILVSYRVLFLVFSIEWWTDIRDVFRGLSISNHNPMDDDDLK